MTLNTPSNTAAVIKDAAKQLGLEIAAERLDALAFEMATFANFQLGAPVSFLDESGQPVAAVDFVRDLARLRPADFSQLDAAPNASTSSTPNLAGLTLTERALVLNTHARQNAAAIKAREAEEIVQRQGNPWRAGKSFNRSIQALVTNTAPDLAARLRAEAGA